MSVFNVRQHDEGVAITKVLEDGLGPVDLTGATVRFHMKPVPESGQEMPILNGAAVVTTAAAGEVAYTWVPGDTDVVGVYNAEWEVTFAGGAVQTFPADEYDTVIIRADID